jgi:hypothetical protein
MIGPYPGWGGAIAVYDFKPDSLTLNGLVTVTITLADVNVNNENECDRLGLYVRDANDMFVPVEDTDCQGSYNANMKTCTKTCTAEVNNFSIYSVLLPMDWDCRALGDLTSDCIVDIYDILAMSREWLLTDSIADIYPAQGGDDLVTFEDFAVVADKFLEKLPVRFYQNTLDSDPHWYASGEWAFGQPAGAGGTEFGNPDPNKGHTGLNVYGVNLNGDYSIAVGGPYFLMAGPFDCNNYNSVMLRFARWLNTDEPGYVESTVLVSNGGPWFAVWKHTGRAELTDDSWRIEEYDISSIADEQNAIYIGWSYWILPWAFPYSGWNIDDIELWGTPNQD